jgi:hypothetical protein
MNYHGSCHCGRIAFDVEGDLEQVMECNCSICRRRGSQMWFVPRDKLTLNTPESDYSTYRFRTLAIAHHFCPTCGCAPFGEGKAPDGNVMAAVNVRCLEGVDFDRLKVIHHDGRSA